MTEVELGARLRDDAIARAAAHANRVSPQWTEVAYCFMRRYAQRHGAVMTEDVRRAAAEHGLSPPPDARAWGSVTKRALREGWLSPMGYTQSKTAAAHRRPGTAIFRSLIYEPDNRQLPLDRECAW